MKWKIAVALIGLLSPTLAAPPAGSQEPKKTVREVVTFSGRVDSLDRFQRILTLARPDGVKQSIYVAPDLKLFDELKTGDMLTVRIRESVIVAVRPELKPSPVVDTTGAAKPTGRPGETEVLQQLRAVVTIESVDLPNRAVIYKGPDNRRVIRAVADPKLLEGLKPGDVVEITYARERAIDLQRQH